MPVISPGSEWLWEAYQVLSERRRVTDQGPDPIAISEILAYATFHRITAEYEREVLMRTVCVLDNAFLAFVRKKRKKGPGRQGR
jgi:hypothetical protein